MSVLRQFEDMQRAMVVQTGKPAVRADAGMETVKAIAAETLVLAPYDVSFDQWEAKTILAARKGELYVFGMAIQLVEVAE